MAKTIPILILLSLIFFYSQSQTFTILGGFSSSTTLGNQQFQDVLAFVRAQHPELANYNLINVKTQPVAGTNYLLTLQSPQGCETDVKVNVPLDGDMTIIQLVSSPCQTTQGGYVAQFDPSGYQFQFALNQALSQNLQYHRSDLVLVETQIVSGINYRFTLRDQSTGNLNQVVIFVPPISSFQPQNITEMQYTDGYVDVRDNLAEYQPALSFIYQDYPEVQGYKIVGVQKSITDGANYRIGFQNNSQSIISYTSFYLFTDIAGLTAVTQTSWINIYGYSVQQINQGCASSLQLHPQIEGFVLKKITNVWPNEGLMLTYEKDGQVYQVFIYQVNGQTKNIIA